MKGELLTSVKWKEIKNDMNLDGIILASKMYLEQRWNLSIYPSGASLCLFPDIRNSNHSCKWRVEKLVKENFGQYSLPIVSSRAEHSSMKWCSSHPWITLHFCSAGTGLPYADLILSLNHGHLQIISKLFDDEKMIVCMLWDLYWAEHVETLP